MYYPLTASQKNIWNLQKFYYDSSISIVSGMLMFEEKLNAEMLKTAINIFIKNQEGTRLRFAEKGGDVYQYVSEYEYVDIPVMSFSNADEAREYFSQDSTKRFTMTDSPMYRFCIFTTPEHSGVYLCFSHLVADAWTASLFCRDVINNYNMLAQDNAVNEEIVSYIDYIKSEEEYQNSNRYIKDNEYWISRFAEKPKLKKIKPLSAESKTIQAKRLTKVMHYDIANKIKTWCSNNNISVAVMFEAAVFTYLYKINEKSNEVIIGIPVLNRTTLHEKEIAGMFISTMPLGVSVTDEDTVCLLCDKIPQSHRELFRHQKFPYSEILKTVREKHDFTGNLFDVMVSYQNAVIDCDSDIKYSTEWIHNGYSEIPLALHIDDRDRSGCLTINMDYQAEVFSDKEAELLYERFYHIINQFIDSSLLTVKDISIIPQAEFDLMIYDFNDTAVDYPRDKCVHELFMEQAAQTPDKIALVFEDKQFTYRQIDEMSNSLAHFLRENGVKPNDIVPIITVRSWHIVVAMLAVFKAGGAYMPTDPNYPDDRINYMIEETDSNIVLTFGFNRKLDIKTIMLESFDFNINTSLIDNVNSPDDTCYVIFTSGSTGKPKGTLLKHSGLVNFTCSNNVFHTAVFQNCQRVLAIGAFTFDISIVETFQPLYNGNSIIIANDAVVHNSELIAAIMTEHNIDSFYTTPTRLSYYLENENFRRAMSEIKVILAAGETFSPELFAKIKSCTKAEVYNGYGPTETTVGCSFVKVTKPNEITIGKPISNVRIYILNQNGKPCPIGVAGELYIAGAGVGKGYLNRPELTAEKFLPDPFVEGSKMYKSGDLARWRADGEIEYLGRIDTQVKIRGLRIELGEIESVISSFDGINMTAVTDKRDENNRQYLVGYYTSDNEIDEKVLRQHLSAKLPKYMIPNYFMRLAEMPMTSTGKTDRKNLPLPEFSDISEEYIAPETSTEKTLAEIWSDILHYDKIGRNSDFIECGGDSLGAISMLAEIEDKFDINMDMKLIMEHTVLSELAACIDKCDRKSDIIPVLHKKEYILTPQQKVLYLACQKLPDSLVYNMPMFIRLGDDTDIEQIKNNIRKCYNRHDILKTSISIKNNEIVGIIDDNAQLVIEDFNDKNDFVRPFDLSKAPLMRVGFGDGGMVIDIHHIVGDGESLTAMIDEILNGNDVVESVGYADYADYFNNRLKNGGFNEHKEYFKNALHVDIEPIELPHSTNADNKTSYIYTLDKKAADTIKSFAKSNNVTETCVYFALYSILLSEFTNKTQLFTSIILSNRTHAEISSTCGMFVNTIPVAVNIDPAISLSEYAENLNKMLLDIYKYQELPMLEICEAVGINDKNTVNSTFVYQPSEMLLNNVDIEYISTNTYKMDLSFQVIPQADGSCNIMLEYNCNKYDSDLMKRLAVGYERIISQIGENIKMSDITVMGESEYNKVVYDFNDTAADYPVNKCAHQIFMEQADKTPDNIAVVFEDKQFTYRQLDEMSNSLAHFLRESGVKPNDIVPIITVRSWHIVVAMLAVFKAGGAYMPIDPNYPDDRINYMIEEAKSDIVLTFGFSRKLNIKTISLENIDFNMNTAPIDNVNSPDDTCYVIFTSGSTGKPKGTLLKHSGLVNLVCSQDVFHEAVLNNCQRVIAIGTFTFDISFDEIFSPLFNGNSIVMVNETIATNSELMAETITNHNIDLLHATPTRLSYYLENENFRKAIAGVNVILAAGEAFSSELFAKIQSCTNAEIYNGYGPTETTVGCSFVKVTKPNEITIGKPISNVRIYILNQNGKPCPIGVAGELYIAGAGVGKGYLNHPKLTAEKFLADPFVEGDRMYRSGDLARWRADGEIEYLGRIDSQVKIRGLRIELGEIENMISSFDGINMAAVADKRDDNGRQYLVGYYTTEKNINEKYLREYLSAKLPKYIIPNYFMRLDEIPMTVSGKTDRKNLPVPERKISTEEFIEPRNDMEKTLCELAAEILNYEKISINDDFFELGGDSLRAIEFTARASEKGITFNLQEIFEHPTIAALSTAITESSVAAPKYFKSDFDRFDSILSRNTDSTNFTPMHKSLGNVLLTGATGFLGSHILDSFMKNETGMIYCLVRGSSYDDSKTHLLNILDYYFGDKYSSWIEKRIIPIAGDILSENLLEILPDDIETVIHSAATVKHYGDYSQFYAVNVKGTENVLNYAKKISAKFMFISTLSVGGANLVEKGNETAVFKESDLYIGQDLSNVYLRSKFEAERLVLEARLAGADCTVYRVGNLTNRFSDGKFQSNYSENAFLRRMKTFVDTGAYPSLLADEPVEFSPVDDTAEAIIRLAEYTDNNCSVFHVNNPNAVTYGQLAAWMNQLGYDAVAVDIDNFIEKIRTAGNSAYDSVLNELNEMTKTNDSIKVVPDSNFTDNILKVIGFDRCSITREYIEKYTKYFDDLNYWKSENTEVLANE